MRKKVARAITYYTPETNIDFAERRMTDFVDEYNWRQRFSARLPRGRDVHPTPTLLDLTVSAYLQGIEDTVQVSTDRGFNFGGNDEHLHGRSKTVSIVGGIEGGERSANSGLERDRHRVAAGANAVAARSDGPHAPQQEFGLPLF